MNRDAIGLRKLHKLTDEHINLSPRFRMHVNLAAQVSKCYSFLCFQTGGVWPMWENNKSKRDFAYCFL